MIIAIHEAAGGYGRGDVARDHDHHLAEAYAQRGDTGDAATTDGRDMTS